MSFYLYFRYELGVTKSISSSTAHGAYIMSPGVLSHSDIHSVPNVTQIAKVFPGIPTSVAHTAFFIILDTDHPKFVYLVTF